VSTDRPGCCSSRAPIVVVEDEDLAGLIEDHEGGTIVHLDDAEALELHHPLVAHLDLGDCRPAEAIPPMWKVRIVNCVPGSPIDWAAMIPTAVPISTIALVAGLIP
jgi:hypothetical protein